MSFGCIRSEGVDIMSNSTLANILYLDEARLVSPVREYLQQRGYQLEVVTDGEKSLAKLDNRSFDLLLINCSAAAFSGLEVFPRLVARRAIPVIVIVDPGNEKVVADAIELGASTYLVRDQEFSFLKLLPVLLEQVLKREQLTGRYVEIINNMQLGLHVYHLDNLRDDRFLRLIAANPTASQLTGLAESDILGKMIDEIFPELRRQGVSQRYAEVVRTGQAAEFEQEVYYGEDQSSETWYSFRVFPLQHDCVGVLFENITLHKQAEESLKQSEARYRAIVEDQTELVDRYLPDGTLTFVNEAYCRYFDRNREELIGHSFTPHLHPDDTEKVKNHIASLNQSSPLGTLEHRVILPHGEVRWQQWTDRAIFDEQGQIVEFQAVGRDITAQKQAEAERERLLVAEREQRLLVEPLHEVTLALTAQTSHEAVLDEILRQTKRLVLCDTTHIVLLEDDIMRTARWYGYEEFGAEQLISSLVQPLADFPLDAEAVQTKMPVVVPDTNQELRWIKVEETAWIRSYITTPICHQDQVLGLLRLDSDTPHRFSSADAQRLLPLANAAAIALENARLYEQARQDADTKSVLLNEVNHRVKNNLTAIIGLLYAEQRRLSVKDQPIYQDIMQNLINHVQGLATVHNLLSASEWKPLRLSDLTGQVIRATLQSLPLSKHIVVDVPLTLIRVTPKQASSLALVINELATNTIKHTLLDRDAGKIAVNMALETSATSRKPTILFEFRDDGPGYPKEVLELNSSKVGLYLVQNIVGHDLDGEATFHNNYGAVTTIRFQAAARQSGNTV